MVLLPGIAIDRSEAQQGGGLPTAETSEFRHVGTEAGGDAGEHGLLAGGDVGLQGVEGGAGAAGGLGSESGAGLAQGAELLDELAAQGEQVTEQNQVAWLGRSCLEAIEVAESGEHDGIDAVVPGETA